MGYFAKNDPNKIFLYAPNLIGFARVLFSLISILIYDTHPKLFLVLYTSSFVADGFDGMVARAWNQTSRLGAVLDMVTDRFSTAALCSILAIMSGSKTLQMVFIMLNILDFVSHWMCMYVSLAIGAASHKDMTADAPKMLQLYYSKDDRRFMCALCVGNELLYVALYAIWSGVVSYGWIYFVYLVIMPLWALKQWMNIVQLWQASRVLVRYEYNTDPHHKNN